MNRTLALLLVTFLGATGLRANFTPAAWHSAALDVVVTTNNNGWYFYPDSSGNPRILAKATTSNNTPGRKVLSGGPPVWTSGASASMGQINKQGVFVPAPGGGGFLIAPHYAGTATTGPLKVAVFDTTGGSGLETVDTNAGTYTGISAELDSTGKLHVGYIWNNSTICYARRLGASNWIFTSQPLPSTTIHDTAVVPITTTDVNLYYCATASGVTSLWQNKPGILNQVLYIQWGANPRIEVERFVGQTLSGSRVGAVGRVYYFGSDNSNSWTFKLYNNLGISTDLETAGNVSPKSIHVGFGPDGKQRVAWYNATSRKIHYLKPVAAGVDIPTLAGQPVALTGTASDPDLLGLHFGPDGTPYLLYRRDLNEGFVAFPNDNFDFNGNGRLEILDTAFNSNLAGPEALPVGPAVSGIFNSANRLKIRFPTIGNAIINATGGVQSTTENLLYKVEVSPDLESWTPLSSNLAIGYTATPASGNLKSFVGVISDPAPGAFPARFARLNVTRLNYPY